MTQHEASANKAPVLCECEVYALTLDVGDDELVHNSVRGVERALLHLVDQLDYQRCKRR